MPNSIMLIAATFLLISGGIVLGANYQDFPKTTTLCGFKIEKAMCEVDKDKLKPSTSIQEARSGCCSHHNGVCGCASNGHQLCCDGATSPSCGC